MRHHLSAPAVFTPDDVICAWLRDVAEAPPPPPSPSPPTSRIARKLRPTTIGNSPPSPPASSTSTTSLKRQAIPPTRAVPSPKRQAVVMDAQQPPRTVRRSARRQAPKRRANSQSQDKPASSTSENDNSAETDEYPGSPTPRKPQRHARLPSRTRASPTKRRTDLEPPRPGVPTNADASPPPSTASTISAYAVAISHRRTVTVSNPPSLPPAPSQASGSTRPRSPVRAMSNLQFAEKPVEIVALVDDSQVPADIAALLEDITKIKQGRKGVVPEALQRDVLDVWERMNKFDDMIEEKHLDKSPESRPMRKLYAELDELAWVVRETKEATNRDHCEAHWNERIHSRILTAAIERDRYCATDQPGLAHGGSRVHVFNSTQATVVQSCIPRHASGSALEAKMVDFCICLSDKDVRDASRAAVAAATASGRFSVTASSSSTTTTNDINCNMSESSAATASSPRKKKAAPAPQSVNHTEYAPLTTSPITVSIETKKPGGSEDEANAQLAVWVSAHFLRLQQLLVDRPVNITLPLLYVSGSTWQVLYAINKGNNIEILRSTRFDGATSTILGCYKVVAVLRALRAWSETVFREWFLDAFVPERRKAS